MIGGLSFAFRWLPAVLELLLNSLVWIRPDVQQKLLTATANKILDKIARSLEVPVIRAAGPCLIDGYAGLSQLEVRLRGKPSAKLLLDRGVGFAHGQILRRNRLRDEYLGSDIVCD